MNRNPHSAPPKSEYLAARIFHWLDERTGIKDILHKTLHEPIPGGARLGYIFGSGLLFIFLVQAVTGVSLALYYTPTAETAHTSVAYITKQVVGGAFLRSLHSYGSSAMIIVLALHFLQTFFYGSFKGRRELLWLSGALLSLLVLGMGFTGYLLPWDQKAYFATAVGTNVAGEAPFIGNLLTRLMRGGDTIGTLTLSRFYVAHVFLIPAMIFLFIAAHVLLFRKAGPAGPINEDPVVPKLASESFYPRQVLFDMGFVLLIMAALAGLSYFHPVTLGPIANPADTHFLPRPEWYYLPMFEWLKFWEGPRVVIGIVVIPGMLASIFFLMPFLDRKLERRPWRRPIPALAVAIVILGMVYLGAKSQIDDREGPIAAQLARQAEEERAYTAAPFQPYIEPSGGMVAIGLPTGSVDPLVAQGKGIFIEHGCVGCHGATGTGTAAAPSLVGVTQKFNKEQLDALLRNPNARMRAGRMPALDNAPASELAALVAYLGALGAPAANVPAVFRPPSSSPLPAGGDYRFSALKRVSLDGLQDQSQSVIGAGRQIFQERACFACHGEAGSGGREPAIALLIARISDTQLKELLANPNTKMTAGGMPPVTVTPEQIDTLVSYLRSLPLPAKAKAAEPLAHSDRANQTEDRAPVTSSYSYLPPSSVAAIPTTQPAPMGGRMSTQESLGTNGGRALFLSQGCFACHGQNAEGTRLAPSLIGIGSKFPGDRLHSLLRHPTEKMRGGGMPIVKLEDSQLAELVAYLGGLQLSPSGPPQGPPDSEARLAADQPAFQADRSIQAALIQQANTPSSPEALRGQALFQSNACGTCHGVGGVNGTVAAPGLADSASLLPPATIESLLRHYSTRMRDGGMPSNSFNAKEIQAIVAYIRAMNPIPGRQSIAISRLESKSH
jgi:ubiquinol-cytochrome c reductase cytochrome b subunit